jgi:hypothetical protein
MEAPSIRAVFAAAGMPAAALAFAFPATALPTPSNPPSGAVSVSVSPDPVVVAGAGGRVPVTVSVSGTSEIEGQLVVDLQSAECAKQAFSEEVGWENAIPVGAGPVGPGSFTASYSTSVDGSLGSHAACAYLTSPTKGVPATYARGALSFPVELAPSPPSGPSRPPTEGAPSSPPTSPAPAAQPSAPHLSALRVRLRRHGGRTLARPGRTELLVSVTPYAQLHLLVRYRSHRISEGIDVERRSTGKLSVRWSCDRPGGVYHYVLTATDGYGDRMVRHGRFRGVSARECRSLREAERRRVEQQARTQHEREARGHPAPKKQPPSRRREEEAQRRYCERRLGGSAREGIVYEGEVWTLCYVAGESRPYVSLRGDPPVVVETSTEVPALFRAAIPPGER